MADLAAVPSPAPASTATPDSSQALKLHQVLHGFKVVQVQPAPLISGTAYLLRHETLGTEVVINHCPDRNKTFVADFVTPATSDNGSNHILEHLVLAGSKNFPLKDPFFFAMKGSFKTFQNAMTSAEHTLYPFATTNQQEFRNLMAMYLDAALNPLLRETAFRQEGFRIDFTDGPDGAKIPVFDGVVYNEMKGGMSDPARRMYYSVLKGMAPETHLGFNSGGDPKVIPTITHEKLTAYHAEHYHPSRARIVLHGDIEIEPVLKDIAAKLSPFAPAPSAVELKLQPAFDAPRQIRTTYAAKDPASPAYQSLAWAIGEQGSLADHLSWDLLEKILLNEASSPLKVAILKSGLCGGLEMAGFFGHCRQTMFNVGVSGVKPGDLDSTAELIRTELGRIVKDGLPPEQVEASLNAYEFALRERHGDGPQGLALADLIFTASKMNGKPLDALNAVDHIAEIRRRLAADPRYFEGLIEKHLMHNPHHVRVDVLADPEHNARFKAEESKAAAEYAAKIGADGIAREQAKNAEMREWIASKDTADVIALVPTLKRTDIPAEVPVVPEFKAKHRDGTILLHDLPTAGITYANIAFDLRQLPERLLPYAPLFGMLLGQVDTSASDYISLSRRISRDTGGIESKVEARAAADGSAEILTLVTSGRGISASAGKLQLLLEEILTGSTFDNRERVLEVAKELHEASKLSLLESGHLHAIHAATSSLHPAYAHRGILYGIEQARFRRDLVKKIEDGGWEEVRADLNEIKRSLINSRATVAIAGEPADATKREFMASGILDQLPAPQEKPAPQWAPFARGAESGGFVVDSDGNYMIKAEILADGWQENIGPLLAAQRAFTYGPVVQKIRIEGNAYSAGAIFHPQTGLFGVYSYRDPRVAESLAVFDGAGQFFDSARVSDSDLTRTIIGSASALLPFELPRDASREALMQHLTGATPAVRQARYESLLRTDVGEFAAVGKFFRNREQFTASRVLGPAEALQKSGIPNEPAL